MLHSLREIGVSEQYAPSPLVQASIRLMPTSMHLPMTVFLLYVFTKGEFSDLPPDKKRVVKALVEEIKKEFA